MLFSLFIQCRKVLRSLWPQPAVRLNRKAERLRAQDKPSEAIALLDQAIRLDSQMAEAYVNRCACYCDLHEYAKAIEDANQAIALAPEMADPIRYRARAAHSLGRSESAIADLSKAQQLAPEDPRIHDERSRVFLGVGDYTAAIAEADRFLERCPGEAHAYFVRAQSRYYLRELASALGDIDEAIRLEGDNADFLCLSAQILCDLDRIDEASAQFEAAVIRNPEFKPGWLGGLIAMKQGNFREAIEQFDAKLTEKLEDPALARVYYDRGSAWYHLREYEKALRDVDEAVWLAPENRPILQLRAKLLFLLDRIEEASAAYETVLAQKREGKEERWNSERTWLGGAIALKQGNYWEAIAQFDAVLDVDPTHSRVYSDRGEAWYRMWELERALSDYDKAVTLDPENPVNYINRANALMGLKRYADAKRDLVEARRLGPDCAHSYRYLAWYMATCSEAEFRNGRQAVAMAHKAIELAGGHPDRELCSTLAAAYAENGEFDEAIRWQAEVLATVSEEDRPRFEAILQNYRAGIPYRLPLSEDSDW